MACLDSIVGVKGCGDAPSGVYVQQLTGISIKDFDKAINTEQNAALPALQQHIAFATQYVLQNIRQHLSSKYELKSFIENDVVGYYQDDKQTIAAQTGYLTGYQVKIDKTPYLNFELGSLSLFVNHSGAVDVKVYDLIQNKLLDTITVTAIAGEVVTVYPNKVYPTHKQKLNLFIGYVSSFESYKTNYSKGLECGCDVCYNNGHINFKAAKVAVASPKTNQYIESNDGGSGLSIGYSLQCSFDEYLCNIRNMIAFPVLYKAGEEIMREMAFSKRLTGVVTIYTTDHKALMEEYKVKHEYFMDQLFQNLSMPESLCFSCNERVKSVVSLP